MPEEKVSNLPVGEGPPHQEVRQGVVQVGLVLEGLDELEQVLGEVLV